MLGSIEAPAYEVLRQGHHSPEDRVAARRGEFTVYGRGVRLAPPVDWDQDPYGSRTWRLFLHNMSWMDALLGQYAESGDNGALEQAYALALDWIRSNPPGRPVAESFAWDEKAVADRVGYLAFIARAAASESISTGEEESELLRSLGAHGDFLADEQNYPPNNHGLFMDIGLFLLGKHLPCDSRSDRWRKLAVTRFNTSLRRQVAWGEGVHLEHSPAYHFLAIQIVRKMFEITGRTDPALARLIERMEKKAGWFVMPDGRLPQLGDTDLLPAPEWAQEEGAANRGLSEMTRSGYAIVKEPGCYLAVAAGYHSRVHRHADDLTFDLFEGGHRIVSDTGKYSYERDSMREFVKSSPAHSVLVVDDRSFPRSGKDPPGSGIRATGEGSGWYAIQGMNRSLRTRRLRHRRLFLYKPSVALVVLDQVRSRREHTYTRYFHLGPDVEVGGTGRTLDLRAGEFRGTLHDASVDGHEAGRTIVAGRVSPPQGLTFPDLGESRARPTIEYRSRGRDVTHLAAFGLGAAPGTTARLLPSRSRTRLLIEPPGGAHYEVEVKRDGKRLDVRERSPRKRRLIRRR